MLSDEWFVSLNNNHRGLFMQLILNCKNQSDDGRIVFRTWRMAAELLGTDRSTLAYFLKNNPKQLVTNSADSGICGESVSKNQPGLVQNSTKPLVIELTQYIKWQELTAKSANAESRRKNDSRAEQSKAKHIYSREEKKAFKEVIENLNKLTGSDFKWDNKISQSQISARLKDGATIDDFKLVHRVKWDDWAGTDMSKYLRPATLYQPSKFEGYLNEARAAKREEENKPSVPY